MQPMSGEAPLEPLLVERAQRGAQAVHHGRRRRVVVEPRGAPVPGELGQIEVVAPDPGRARGQHSLGPVVVRQRRQTRGTAQALLRAGDRHVDLPAVHGDLRAAERHDGVGEQQRLVTSAEARDVLQRLQHAGGGLTVDERDEPSAASLQRGLYRLRLDDASPLGLHRHDLGAAAFGDLDQQQAEAPALTDDDALARLHQRDDRGFQARAPRARHRERPLVPRLEREAAEGHDLVHDRGELGIELAEERGGHRAQHARVGRAGAGPEQDARAGDRLIGWIGRHRPLAHAPPGAKPRTAPR